MLVVPGAMETGPGCSGSHAVGSPYCRGRMLSTPLYRAVDALCCGGEGPVSYCQRPCAVLPATINGALPLSALSHMRGPIKVNTRHPQAGSCCIVHRYQTTGTHPPWSCHNHLPPTPYASGIRSQTLLRPDLHGILDLLALHPLPDHGCFLFLHPSSPHQRPCLLARSGCEPRFSLFHPSRSTSYLDCWLVISPCPAR